MLEFEKITQNLLNMSVEHKKFFDEHEEYLDNLFSDNRSINIIDKKNLFFKKEYENTRTNAYLVYSFSIFEIFATKLLKHLIKSNHEVKKRYFGKWDKFLNEKMEGNHKHIALEPKHFSSDQAKVENYQILLVYEKANIANFIASLIGIKAAKNNTYASRQHANFNLYWKIRHLLTHRGEEIDEKLLKEISNNKSIKEETGAYETFLKFQFRYHDIKIPKTGKLNPKKLLGKKLKILFPRVIESVLFQSAWLVIHTKDKDLEREIFTHLYHDLLVTNEKIKTFLPSFLTLGRFIYLYELDRTHDNDSHKVPDSEKFNFQLINFEEYKSVKNILNKGKAPKNELSNLSEAFNKRKTENFVFTKLEKNMVDLLDAHLNNNKSKFLSLLESIDFSDYGDDWDDWFIFRKYQKNKTFKEIVSTKKNKLTS